MKARLIGAVVCSLDAAARPTVR